MLRPIFDNMRFETFAFFVPYRTIFDNHEKFHGAQDDPADSIDFTIPLVTGTNARTTIGSLWDHFGLPVPGTALDPDDVTVSSLPYRAYGKIWNDWFRDENLQEKFYDGAGAGPDALQSSWSASSLGMSPLKRGKRKDYFTSCLPWPQKQTTGVTMPLGTTAPIVGIAIQDTSTILSGLGAGTSHETDNPD